MKNQTEAHQQSSNKNAMLKAHEIISIQNRVPVKSIRVERDYSLGDGITRFSTQYPVELEGKVKCNKKAGAVFLYLTRSHRLQRNNFFIR